MAGSGEGASVMLIELIRDDDPAQKHNYGKFFVDKLFFGETLEDKDRYLEAGGEKVYRCFHVDLLAICCIAPLVTPYILAKAKYDFFSASIILISKTCSAVSFFRLAITAPRPCLAFFTMSALFSCGVPKNKCDGFTQLGLSQ